MSLVPDMRFSSEKLVAVHVAGLSLLATWMLGGGSAEAVFALSIAGSLAPVLTLLAWRERRLHQRPTGGRLLLLLTLLALNLVVLASLLQPALRTTVIEGGPVYILRQDLSAWPCSARPDLTLKELWLLDALYLSCFNLLIAVQQRRIFRALLVVLSVNALVLAVFGSIQKFVQSSGLYFGAVASPNPTFFASFIYHNHWGAYAILMLAVMLGLLFHRSVNDGAYRDFWHSPAAVTLIASFLLATTLPLSGARICTLLGLVLLTAGAVHGLRKVMRHRRSEGKSAATAGIAITVTIGAALSLAIFLAQPVIEERLNLSRQQISHMHEIGGLGSRSQLYQDTLKMATDRLWFGWGMGSYGTVFQFYNNQHAIDGLPQFYEDAHSDWLQRLAETGIVGSLLQLSLLLAPLNLLRKTRRISSLAGYLLGGCGAILLYAWIEFPFGNPAVTLTFWTCYFCALRHQSLENAS